MDRDPCLTETAPSTGEAQYRLSGLRAYWQALSGGDRLPARSQIDPRGIADCLEQCFLIERIGAGTAQFRISGRAMNGVLGMEGRGLPFSSLFLTEARARLSTLLERMFAEPALLSLTLAPERRIGHDDPVAQMIILPLLDHKGHCTVAIGAFDWPGCEKPCSTGRRFAISGAEVTRAIARPLAQGEVDALARPTIAPPQKTGRRQSHLRLVHSAD